MKFVITITASASAAAVVAVHCALSGADMWSTSWCVPSTTELEDLHVLLL